MTDQDSTTREVEIEALAGGGRGVGRLDGKVWLVRGGIPGDRVAARILHDRPRYVEAAAVEVLRPSMERRQAACPLQSGCGGCPWMALDEASQRLWKRQLVADAMKRLGGLEEPEPEAMRIAGPPFGYRNKVEFTLGTDEGGRPQIGLYASAPDGGLIDVDRCLTQHDDANAVLESARGFLLSSGERYREAFRSREPLRLVIRRSGSTGQMLVALRETADPFAGLADLADHLRKRHENLRGVVRLRAKAGRRGGSRIIPVTGRAWLEEQIGEVVFRVPAGSFLQVGSEAASVLVAVVAECAGQVEGKAVLDLYGGVGAFGLDLARRGARVTVCEADGAAVSCGRRAAEAHGLRSVRFVDSDVGAFLRSERRVECDLLLANPPRTGLGRGVVESMARLRAERIVLVSCDPATLARDVRRLAQRGYRAERIVPVDVFPQTAHVETVLSLVRRPV